MKLTLLQKFRLLQLFNLLTNEAMLEKLKSRKLWATVIAGAFATVGTHLGIAESLLETIINLVMVYVGSQAVVDASAAVRK